LTNIKIIIKELNTKRIEHKFVTFKAALKSWVFIFYFNKYKLLMSQQQEQNWRGIGNLYLFILQHFFVSFSFPHFKHLAAGEASF